jgi:hypothetical protein
MKNKLLVSAFAVGLAAFALTSCETKSNVTEVCTDMVKETLHKNARSLEQLDEQTQTLTIEEYDFLGGINDNRLAYRSIAFGNGVAVPKTVDTLTYEYGEWVDHGTAFTLLVTPKVGDPFTMIFKGNAFLMPDKRVFGGDATSNNARVEKWESVINSLPNTAWEATFKGEYVTDSVFRDSIRTTFIPPVTFIIDTIPVFDHLDTVSADTTCYYRWEFKRDLTSQKNTGHLYRKGVRTKYDRATRQETIVKEEEKEFDFEWYFSTVASDAKFSIALNNTTPAGEEQILNITKYAYKVQADTTIHEFMLGGLLHTRYVPVP